MTKSDKSEYYSITEDALRKAGLPDKKINEMILQFKEWNYEADKYRKSKIRYFEEIIPKYEKCLEEASREEDVQAFLTENIQLSLEAFSDGSAPLDIVPKFKLGQDYITDFTLLGVRSFGKPYHVVFVELESPNAQPFTKAGVYSQTLNKAMKQINEWRAWLKDKFETFCADFPNKLNNYNSSSLRDDLRSSVITYKIIIGRRKSYTNKDRALRGAFFDSTHGNVEIMSYDNIGDIARRYLEFKMF